MKEESNNEFDFDKTLDIERMRLVFLFEPPYTQSEDFVAKKDIDWQINGF